MTSSNIFLNTGKEEWYTPSYIIEAAREVFGGQIELDVASTEQANKIVQAKRFYTREDDALSKEWWTAKTVWMNHPYNRKHNLQWVEKLVHSYKAGHIAQGMCITYNSTETHWFRPLHRYVQCYLYKRVSFIDPDTMEKVDGSQKGNVITYLGPDIFKFTKVFEKMGSVKQPIGVDYTIRDLV